MRVTDVAELFHGRLVWLVRDSGLTQTEVARRVGRSQAAVSEWLSEENWNLPDAEAMLRLPDALSRQEKHVSETWFLTGKGSPYAIPSAPGSLFYRGRELELAEMELMIRARRAQLQEEEANPNGGGKGSSHPSNAADRVARTSQLLRDAAKGAKKHRRSG